jgi:hypothetical protein
MTPCDSLASISDDELFATVQHLTARANVALAALLAHLGEVERRGVHRLRACASLYTYCIYELRMSEDAAYRRSKAARLVREYPELGDAIAKGELHLTGVLMIGPHLGGERHAEILRRARFRSKRELLRLLAEIDPKPDVPALVEPIGPAPAGHATHVAFVEALAAPVRELPPGRRPEDWIAEGDDDAAAPSDDTRAGSASAAEPADEAEQQRELRYRVQFTASQEFVDLLEEASELIGHETPRATLPEIQVRALRALVQELRVRKRAASRKNPAPVPAEAFGPAPARPLHVGQDISPARSLHVQQDTAPARPLHVGQTAPEAAPAASTRRGARHVPASVRRAVFDRDGARCSYRNDRGARCRETIGLEVHHRHAHALGGPATLDNLELRCRAHNTLAAEQDFGRDYMDFARGVTDGSRAGAARARLPTGETHASGSTTVVGDTTSRRS